MKLKFYNVALKELDGTPMFDKMPTKRFKCPKCATETPIPDKEDGTDGKIATLQTICVGALQAQFQDEQSLSGIEKFKRYNLALKIDGSKGEVDITAEEIALIKELIGKGYTVAAVGQAYNLLELGKAH